MYLPSWEPSPRFSVGLAPRKEQGWGPLRLWSSHRGDVMDILKVLGEFSPPQCSQTTCWFTGWRYFFGWGNTPSPIWRILSQNPKFQWIITVTGGSHHSTNQHRSWFMETGWILIAPPQLQLRCFTESFSITRYLVLSFDWVHSRVAVFSVYKKGGLQHGRIRKASSGWGWRWIIMIVLTLERKLFNTTSENMANIFHRWIVEIVYPDP